MTPRITYRDAWGCCKHALLAAVGDDAYTTWFSGLQLAGLDRRHKTLRLMVASPFLERWIHKYYHDLLFEVCRSEWPTLTEVDVSVRTCVVRDLRSKPLLLLPTPVVVPLPVQPQKRDDRPTKMPLSSVRLIERIKSVVAKHYDVSVDDLQSEKRTRKVARPRQIAMYLAKTLTLRSLPEIGKRFGGRDHTTILHAVRKFEALVAKDPAFAEEIEFLKRQLQT